MEFLESRLLTSTELATLHTSGAVIIDGLQYKPCKRNGDGTMLLAAESPEGGADQADEAAEGPLLIAGKSLPPIFGTPTNVSWVSAQNAKASIEGAQVND